MKVHSLSERRACRLASVSRSQFRYVPSKKEDPRLVRALIEIKEAHKSYGVPRVTVLLRRRGFLVNHKRVYRIVKTLRMLVPRRKTRKRLTLIVQTPRVEAVKPNHVWSMDFVSEKLVNGKVFRCLTVIDTYSRVAPLLHAAHSMRGYLLIKLFEKLKQSTTLPEVLIVDNGPEFKNYAFIAWCKKHNVRLHFIDPGSPTQNAFIESFNARFRDECLNQHRFHTIDAAQATIRSWLDVYNNERPHSSLDYLTPKEFAHLETEKLSSENQPRHQILVDLKTG